MIISPLSVCFRFVLRIGFCAMLCHFFFNLILYPDHKHQNARMPITKMNMYVAIVPMKILPLCTSNATFQSDIGSWFMLEG